MRLERTLEKIVIDTNVFISALFWKGASHRVLELTEKGKFELILTKKTSDEFFEVLNRRELKEKIETKNLILSKFVLDTISMGTLIESKTVFFDCEDSDDNKFLEAAFDGECKYIISQDKHLLKMKEFKGIKILTPEEYLAKRTKYEK